MRKTEMRSKQHGVKGFTLVELLTVAAVIMIAFAIAVPMLLSAYRSYELTNGATQVEMVLKYTRLEAIRLNTRINCDSQLLGNGNYQIWTDSNNPVNDGIAQRTEKQVSLNSTANLVALGVVPNTAPIAVSLGVAALTGIAPASVPMVQFDQRGAVVNPVGLYAVAIGNTLVPTAGYRIVILLPSGSTQIWAGDANGNWHQTN